MASFQEVAQSEEVKSMADVVLGVTPEQAVIVSDDLKLGKLAAARPKNAAPISKFLKSMPPPPRSVDLTKGQTSWGMMNNDRLGCCTCAAAGHMIQVWTLNSSTEVTVSDQLILQAYCDVGGYVPGYPSTDRGAVEVNVLNYWYMNPKVVNHRISGYGDVVIRNVQAVKQAINAFGGLYIGVALPQTASWQIQRGQPWSKLNQPPYSNPGTWGGHAINLVGYDDKFLTCITWGKLQKMTWNYYLAYTDEVHAVVSRDWLNAQGQSPLGQSLQQLLDDLRGDSPQQ
jgi:hypothetical protein